MNYTIKMDQSKLSILFWKSLKVRSKISNIKMRTHYFKVSLLLVFKRRNLWFGYTRQIICLSLWNKNVFHGRERELNNIILFSKNRDDARTLNYFLVHTFRAWKIKRLFFRKLFPLNFLFSFVLISGFLGAEGATLI